MGLSANTEKIELDDSDDVELAVDKVILGDAGFTGIYK
jgi:hypothetical protein